MGEIKKSGRKRKDLRDLKRVFPISLYFTQREIDNLGGKEVLRNLLYADKVDLQKKYDAISGR